MYSVYHRSYHLQRVSEEMMLSHSSPHPVGWSILSLQSLKPLGTPGEPCGPSTGLTSTAGTQERTLSLAAGPWLPCSPFLAVLCLQLWSALQIPTCWAGISHSDSLSSRDASAVCPGWRAGCLPSSATPSHTIYCGSIRSRPGIAQSLHPAWHPGCGNTQDRVKQI